MVELVFSKIKSAHHGADGTAARIQRHKSAFHLRQLGDLPRVPGRQRYPNHRPAAHLDIGRGFFGKARLRRLQAFASDLQHVAIEAHRLDFFGISLQHHSSHHIAIVWMLVQRFVNGIFELLAALWQCDELLRPAVDLAPFKVHDAPAQRLVRHVLVTGTQGGEDVEPARVGFIAVLDKHQLAHRFGHVFGVYGCVVSGQLDFQLLLLGGLRLLRRDEVVLQHAVNHANLPRPRALGVADRVVG